ncbi:N-acetylmuramoyl-L-alanine amidase [Gracilimonas tropica]|uniref:N-acetylmuramoyl-L-alanine amidase n=1 Tax=Gracilimonas tropica TaxID=454600 RepID=UPI0003794BA0|nr:N-acetylmuramoyl-L-alanine amidase [Gracilimonas tropica]
MKYLGFLFTLLIFYTTAFAQVDTLAVQADSVAVDSTIEAYSDSLYLNIVIPETDTVMYPYSRYRIAGNTNPRATVVVNGNLLKVYESGAFVDMISHTADTTQIHFMTALNGDSLSKTMYLIRPEPPKPISLKGKTITDRFEKPGSNRWFKTGEKLEVQFLGTPGQKVVFNIDGFKRNIPMHEVPVSIAGVEGLYRGVYLVRPSDFVKDKHITFKMKKNFFSYKKKKSTYTVSFNGLPRVGRVNSDDAYLNIGMGTDRLGGAKYGDLEEGVLLNITGLKNDNYKVQLSRSLSAWIPTRFVDLESEYSSPVESLTGNIRISGEDKLDRITLNLSEKLPYISYTDVEPNVIIVDVFGATSNTNWKIKHRSSHGIKDVTWSQVEDGRFRIEIELSHSQNWGYHVGYGWGSQLNIEVRRPPVVTNMNNPLEGRTISVDAGHGGDNNGALGADGTLEKNVTLQITKKLEELLLEKGANVILPRTDDSYVYMSERKEITLENEADLLVSIHANSIGYISDPREIKGTGAFYKHMAFRPLAEIMYKNMMDLGFDDYGLTGSFNFSLNAPIEFPNVLVETAFISNPEEEMLLMDPDFQQKIAEQIVKGLEEFYLKHGYLESVSDMPEK